MAIIINTFLFCFVCFCFYSGASSFGTPLFKGHCHSGDTKFGPGKMQWWIQGRSLGGHPPPPPYFWTKLRPEGLKNIFLETGPSPLDDHSPPLSLGLGPPLKCSHNLCICCLY